MIRRAAAPLLLAAATLILTACGATGPSEEETASLASFAETSCSGLASVYEADDALSNLDRDIEELGTAEEQHAAAVEGVRSFIDLLEQSRDDVIADPPLVDAGEDGQDGDAIVALFTDYYDTWIDEASSTLDAFAAEVPEFGPNEDGVRLATLDLVSDVKEYGVPELVFPYGDIEDQDVIAAIDDESSCDDIVTVW